MTNRIGNSKGAAAIRAGVQKHEGRKPYLEELAAESNSQRDQRYQYLKTVLKPFEFASILLGLYAARAKLAEENAKTLKKVMDDHPGAEDIIGPKIEAMERAGKKATELAEVSMAFIVGLQEASMYRFSTGPAPITDADDIAKALSVVRMNRDCQCSNCEIQKNSFILAISKPELMELPAIEMERAGAGGWELMKGDDDE